MHDKSTALAIKKKLKSYGANSIHYKIIYIPWYKLTVGIQ